MIDVGLEPVLYSVGGKSDINIYPTYGLNTFKQQIHVDVYLSIDQRSRYRSTTSKASLRNIAYCNNFSFNICHINRYSE